MERRRREDQPPGARRLLPALGAPLALVVACALAAVGHRAGVGAGASADASASGAALLVGVAGALGEALLLVLALNAMHELGHVLAGVAVGLPFRAVTLGPVTLRRERRAGRRAGRLVWTANRCWRRFAGCVEREVEPGPGVRVALTVTALGGPVASVVGGVALLWGAPAGWEDAGVASVLIGVVNALPVRVLGQASDGTIVRRLWSGRAGDVAWRAGFCGDGAVG